jgi:tetratricopeptide (TPR) repeat protein
MSGNRPWLKFSLLAWAIATASLLILSKGVTAPFIEIMGGLLIATAAGVFMDWLWNGIGNLLQNKNGRESLRKADPAVAHYRRGGAFSRNGEFDRAVASFSTALRLNPSYVDALIGRGIALYKKGDYENAIADFSEAISTDLKSAKAYYYRGSVYNRQGKYKSAVFDFDQSLRIDPTQEKARILKEFANHKIMEAGS